MNLSVRKVMGLMALAAILAFASIAAAQESSEGYSVVDSTGRTVEFTKVPERALSIGHGALKLYAYIAGSDRLVGIEETEKTGHTVTGQSIHYAYPELREFETIGKGGSKFEPDYELLKFAEPDVIFVAYSQSADELDALQKTLDIPVVGIDAGMRGDVFGEKTYQTFDIIGKVLKLEDRANEVNTFIREAEKDLQSRAGSIEESPRMYLGGCSFRGEQGILSTKTHLDLLSTVNAFNIMDELTDERSVMIDKEKLLDLDPEMIILDLSGKTLLDEDMAADPEFYRSLSAFRNKNAHYIMPYFTYGMNYDTAILNMYFIGSLAHPENFADIDLKAKAAEIYTLFVGKDVYADLLKTYPESFTTSTFANE